MSGAEVGLVLGIISSVIAVFTASQKLFDAAKDTKGLHEAFRKVAENVPLVLGTLRAAEEVQKKMEAEWQSSDNSANKQAIETTSKEIEPVFETCEANARALRDIFEKVVPGNEANRVERYRKALKTVLPGKKRKVEGLMQEILEKLQLLHTHHYFNTAVDVSKIGAGIEELRTVESSDPDESDAKYVNSGSGPQNIHSGSGKQFNNTISGGTGNSQHIADSQTFHYGAK
jgi:Sec-independent protein translocase protein TatA